MYENLEKKKDEVLKAIGKGTSDYKELLTKVSGGKALVDEAIDDLIDDEKISESDGKLYIAGEEAEPVEKGRFCTKCGKKLETDAAFCPHCGAGAAATKAAEAAAVKPTGAISKPLGVTLLTILFTIPACVMFIGGMANIEDNGSIAIMVGLLLTVVARWLWKMSRWGYYATIVLLLLPAFAVLVALGNGNVPAPLTIIPLLYAYIVWYLKKHRSEFR